MLTRFKNSKSRFVIEEGSLVLNCDFSGAGNLSNKEVEKLVKELNSRVALSNATCEIRYASGHRGILSIRGIRSKLSDKITIKGSRFQVQSGCETFAPALESAFLVNEWLTKAVEFLKKSIIISIKDVSVYE